MVVWAIQRLTPCLGNPVPERRTPAGDWRQARSSNGLRLGGYRRQGWGVSGLLGSGPFAPLR